MRTFSFPFSKLQISANMLANQFVQLTCTQQSRNLHMEASKGHVDCRGNSTRHTHESDAVNNAFGGRWNKERKDGGRRARAPKRKKKGPDERASAGLKREKFQVFPSNDLRHKANGLSRNFSHLTCTPCFDVQAISRELCSDAPPTRCSTRRSVGRGSTMAWPVCRCRRYWRSRGVRWPCFAN